MRLVRRFVVLGQKWESFELEPGDDAAEHGVDDEPGAAVTLTSDRQVVFRRAPNAEASRVLAAHELLHVAMDASGAEGLIGLLAHASKLDPGEVEEALVVALAPALAPLLDSIFEENP